MSGPMNPDDAELERLLADLSPDELGRGAIREAHRQLEKDLLRLADPPPPADFLAQVMAKVEAEPRRVSGAELRSAAAIIFAALGASLGAFVFSGASADGVAVSLAQTFVSAREFLVGFGSGLAALWRTAGLPISAALALVVMVALVGFRRLLSPMTAKAVL
jgi:hypothetical protein